jgi:hypothetical protein
MTVSYNSVQLRAVGGGRELFALAARTISRASSQSIARVGYGADEPRKWIKVKNINYSQAVDRRELFER